MLAPQCRPLLTTVDRGTRRRADRQSDDRLIDRYRLDPAALRDDIAFAPIKPISLYLEIGFGKGEHLWAQACASPDIGFIGSELYRDGLVALARKLATQSPDGNNIRLYDGDARDLIASLPDQVLRCISILYPDPWPKRRHHKRRLINPTNLAAMARVLCPAGDLVIVTDNADYAAWILHLLHAHPQFDWTAESCHDWRETATDWVATRYEHKAVAAGRHPCYFRFRRC